MERTPRPHTHKAIRLTCAVLALTLGLSCAATLLEPDVAWADSRKEKRTKLSSRLLRLKRERRETQADIRAMKGKQRDVLADLREVQSSLHALADRITASQKRLRLTRSHLAATRARLSDAREDLKRDRRRLGRRLRAARRSGDCGYLSVALGAKDFWDLLDREHFVSRVVKSDVTLIESLKKTAERIEADEERLGEQETLQKQWVAELNEDKLQQREEHSRLQAIYDRLNRERKELEAVLAQQERDSEAVRAMLEALAETPEGRARAAVRWRGGFIAPVHGRLTSGFGYRRHPVLHTRKLHTGVDFSVPVGTTVRAAAGGVVVHAGWLGAYGNAVILDHGGGVSTLYGHLSSVGVSPGRSVGAGDTIGRSGNTGYSTGPHVHFEKRINGRPVRPF